MRPWLLAPIVIGMASCALDEEPASTPAPQPLDQIWERTIRRGDILVLVPGTGTHDYIAAPIEALDHPVVDVRVNETVASDATVFEQAIAAAHRAGLTDQEIEAGAVTFLLWGAGFERLESFEYISYEHLKIRVDVLGGKNSCADGFITDNLFNYTWQSADADARDLYARLRSWLVAHPSAEPRNAVVMAHSWGGAVAEYLALEQPAIAAALGPLVDGSGIAAMPFTVAAGVPSFILGYEFLGPSARDIERPTGPVFIYEIDRPDDPVHNMVFEGDYGGHRYNILFGDDYRGSYGITTSELSCHGVPGACAAN